MARCAACAGEIRDAAALRCPYCDAELAEAGTVVSTTETRHEQPDLPVRAHIEVARLGAARFPPGHMFASRFRVVSLLGRGAMGEVYRAEDLKLGQPVALKLLSAPADRSGASLVRFASEVRLARAIAHPNVCRVFDIGEADGWHYLSMEYVDGETLASVRERIGRLPLEKALDVARQLCAGIGAAHAHGVLHRDLKPSNIMLDGRGRVRIMDFGLAMRSGDRVLEIAGTPAYMAPEQLTGAVATERTDLYALGLVLYETFTGNRVFEARTFSDRARTPLDPRTLSFPAGVDADTAGIVRACLAVDPAARPPSTARVAARFPGGDAISAALAEGRVLPPDIVAAAATSEAMPRAVAAPILALIALGVLIVFGWGGRLTVTPAELPKPTEALAERAQQILLDVGHDSNGDRAYWFDSPTRRAQGRALGFAYRTSADYLVPVNFLHFVTMTDPPMDVAGMATVQLDLRGRLIHLSRIPMTPPSAVRPEPWPRLFAEAGLSVGDFEPVDGRSPPLVGHDHALRWRSRPHAGSSLEVSAATLSGDVVYFDVADTALPELPRQSVLSRRQSRLGEVVLWLFIVAIFGATMVMVRRNLRAGEGDLQGARRLAVLFVAAGLLGATLFSHHVPSLVDELTLFLGVAGWMLLWGGFCWLSYVAFEPHARRLWPRSLISWTRILEGRVRDPLVGRDVLVGVLAGVLIAVAEVLLAIVDGEPLPDPFVAYIIDSLRSTRHFWSRVNFYTLDGLQWALGAFFMLLFLRLLLRKTWLAVVVLTLLAAPMMEGRWTLAGIVFTIGAPLLVFAVLLRVGLLAGVAMMVAERVLTRVPLTLDLSAWYAGSSVIVLLLILGMAGWAYSTATRGRRLDLRSSLAARMAE
jgi:predicted Ser/Thr protein kinase